MLVKRKSVFTGKTNVMNLPITGEQLVRWERGELIQRVFPHLTPDQREFLKSGCTPEEFKAALGPET